MAELEASKSNLRKEQLWPLSVQAYHALGELNLIPHETELLYGQVFRKISKSPFHSYLLQTLQEALHLFTK